MINKEKVMDGSGPIHKYDISDTVKTIAHLVEIFPDKLMDGLLGSAGKQEVSGDIDLAIEDTMDNIIDVLERNHATFKTNKGLNCVHLLVEIEGPKRKIPNYTGLVQVDLFFGNKDWLKFSHFSAGDASKHKGMYRTILLQSIVSATTDFTDNDEGGNLIAKIGPVFNLSEGIRTQYRIALAKKNGEGYIKKLVEVEANASTFIDRYGIIETKHIDISNPADAARYIFEHRAPRNTSTGKRNNITEEALESFEQVHKLMLECIPPKKQKIIQKIFLTRTGKNLRIHEGIEATFQNHINNKYRDELARFKLSSWPNLDVDRTIVDLSHIRVEEKYRGTGIGTKVMQEVITWADQNNTWITLSLADDQRNRLKKFYKRFGFVENKGRNKDFALSMYTAMYRKPKVKVNEQQTTPMPWNGNPTIGWWLNNETIVLYHGTHKNHVPSILQNGLETSPTGRTAGITYLALDPFTGRGYGAMSGETEFREAGRKAKHVPMEDRATIVFEFPREYVEQFMNWNNPKLVNRESYEKFVGSDHEYYELAEVRHPGKIPAKFITGHM